MPVLDADDKSEALQALGRLRGIMPAPENRSAKLSSAYGNLLTVVDMLDQCASTSAFVAEQSMMLAEDVTRSDSRIREAVPQIKTMVAAVSKFQASLNLEPPEFWSFASDIYSALSDDSVSFKAARMVLPISSAISATRKKMVSRVAKLGGEVDPDALQRKAALLANSMAEGTLVSLALEFFATDRAYKKLLRHYRGSTSKREYKARLQSVLQRRDELYQEVLAAKQVLVCMDKGTNELNKGRVRTPGSSPWVANLNSNVTPIEATVDTDAGLVPTDTIVDRLVERPYQAFFNVHQDNNTARSMGYVAGPSLFLMVVLGSSWVSS